MTRRPKINEWVVLKQLRKRAYYAQKGRCYFCDQPFPLSEITADHHTPRYVGGQTKSGNIVASCAPCNNTRNSETNRFGKNFKCIVGDDTPRSPFEVLASHAPLKDSNDG